MTRSKKPLVMVLALLLASCGSESDRLSVEEEVRAFVANVEDAAESRDIKGITNAVSEQYYDSRGQTKLTVANLVQYYLSSRRSVHVLASIREIVVTDSTHAQLRVAVGLAGRPMESADEIGRMGADLFTFDVRVAKEDSDWLVSSAEWRRARPGEFLKTGMPQ